jgi:hypothetical protein
MSVTIEPTVTPALKPEWPEITGYLCRDGFGYVSILVGDEGDVKEDIREQNLLHLATVTIPSSAECERRAAALAELERASEEMEEDIGNADQWHHRADNVERWLEARNRVRELLGEGRGK